MAFYQRPEKILALACNCYPDAYWTAAGFWRWQRIGAIYLHFILMIMENRKSSPAKTMLAITFALIVLFVAKKWNWALIAALIIGATGVFSEYASKKLDVGWIALGKLLNRIFPPLILGLIFYVFVFPVSLLYRILTKKDALLLKKSPGSTFSGNRKEFDKPSFEKTW
jgi:hypothetical protein